jgi:DNA-binding MarR family transcriptional regulator/GNAT superfamily N-acetyltransferase
MSATSLSRIHAVRQFNRFYTRRIGMLNEGLLESPFSLAEVRLMYELSQGTAPTATDLAGELDLDPGYLSRLLRGLERRGLSGRERNPADRRQRHLRLTGRGKRAFASLDRRARLEVSDLLAAMSIRDQVRLTEAMETIRHLLEPETHRPKPDKAMIQLRDHRPGDLGWMMYRHGVLYAQEYGWDYRFEALVARVVAEFVEQYDARRERCWIAEREGEILGSVMLVKDPKRPDTTAKLRLLLVEPAARGLGIGRRLVAECTRFAKEARYQAITLWTNSVLHAARHLYEEAGYRLIREEPHQLFGEGLVGQTWELEL